MGPLEKVNIIPWIFLIETGSF